MKEINSTRRVWCAHRNLYYVSDVVFVGWFGVSFLVSSSFECVSQMKSDSTLRKCSQLQNMAFSPRFFFNRHRTRLCADRAVFTKNQVQVFAHKMNSHSFHSFINSDARSFVCWLLAHWHIHTHYTPYAIDLSIVKKWNEQWNDESRVDVMPSCIEANWRIGIQIMSAARTHNCSLC